MLALAHAACRQWRHCLPAASGSTWLTVFGFSRGSLLHCLFFYLTFFFPFILSHSLVLLRLFPWSSSVSLSHLPIRVRQRPRLLPSLPWLRADKGPCLPAWLPELDLRGPTRCQGRTVPCKSSCELHNAPPKRNKQNSNQASPALLARGGLSCLHPLCPSSILLPSLLEPLALILLCYLVIQVQDTFLDSGFPQRNFSV